MIDIVKSEFLKNKRTSTNKFILITPFFSPNKLLSDYETDYAIRYGFCNAPCKQNDDKVKHGHIITCLLVVGTIAGQ